jgi:hypothetical protein
MLAHFIRPKILWISFGVTLALRFLLRGLEERGWRLGFYYFDLDTIAGVVTLAIAIGLSLQIAAEHRRSRKMQLCWVLLAANAGLTLFRCLLENPHIWIPLFTPDFHGLFLQIVIFPANLCLLAAVIMMWLALRVIDLPIRLRWTGWALIGLVIALTGLMMFFRAGFNQAESPYLLARYSQHFGIIVFFCYGVFSIILYRMTVEMGSSHLTRAIRCLILYMLLRGGAFVLGSAQVVLHREYQWPDYTWLLFPTTDLIWFTVRWLPALMAAYRWQMSAQASRKLADLRDSQSGNLLGATIMPERPNL